MPIDYKKYPKNWKEIVAGITKRSKHRCEWCGLKNHSTVYSVRFYIRDEGKYSYKQIWFRNKQDARREAQGKLVKSVYVVLTVAHLDHDEENKDIRVDRLAHLCQICHLRYDIKEKYRRAITKNN